MIVFTNGCFDLLHPGHVRLLQFAREQGIALVVGLNSDASVRRLKPGRPIMGQEARREILLAIRWVDAVIIFDEDTPERLIREIRPSVLVKGADWVGREVAGAAFVESYGGRVAFAPFANGYSTSETVLKIRGSNNATAHQG